MNIFLKALLALSILSSSLSAKAQCSGCTAATASCPASNQEVQACGTYAFATKAGDTLSEAVTFALPVSFVIRQGQPVPGFPSIPGFPAFTAPFDINVAVDTVNLTSVTGLPAGLSWESDSAANGNHYLPYIYQYGCVRFCGDLACGSAGTYNATINFTFKTYFSTSDPTFQALLDQTLGNSGTDNDGSVDVVFTVDPSTSLVLDLTTAGPSTVIDSGETVTLNATPGFNSYTWSSGETTETVNVSPTDTTWYVVTATDSLGCTQTDSMEIQVLSVIDSIPTDTTGITTVGYNSQSLSIYPNPSKGSFTVNVAQPLLQGAMIEVVDITGKRVYSTAMLSLNNTITLDTAKGLYLVKVITGNSVLTKKLLIH